MPCNSIVTDVSGVTNTGNNEDDNLRKVSPECKTDLESQNKYIG